MSVYERAYWERDHNDYFFPFFAQVQFFAGTMVSLPFSSKCLGHRVHFGFYRL